MRRYAGDRVLAIDSAGWGRDESQLTRCDGVGCVLWNGEFGERITMISDSPGGEVSRRVEVR